MGHRSIRIGTIQAAIVSVAAFAALLLFSAFLSSAEAEEAPERGALFAQEVEVLERSGLPSAQATTGIEVQTAIDEARLVPKLEAAMGEAFGGVWYQAETAQLHIGVTSEASRRTAEAVADEAGLTAHVTEVPVSSTWTAISAAKEEWTRNLEGLLRANQAMIWTRPETNSLEVRLASAVPAEALAALRLEASAASVQIDLARTLDASFGIAPKIGCRAFAAGEAFCDPTITAGVTMRPPVGGNCTFGPTVVKDPLGANTTETFILTAGHCIEAAGEQFESSTKGKAPKVVGKAVVALEEAIGSEVDVGVVKVENTEWTNSTTQTPVNPAVASWAAVESNPVPVAGQKKPVIGAVSCHSGQTTGTNCGKVNKDELAVGTLKELVEVRELPKEAEGGDSGGPFFVEEKTGLMAEGTLVGNLEVGGEETEWALFEPLWFSFKALEPSGVVYKLLTTANQTRPKCPMPGTKCVKGESYPVTLSGSQLVEHVLTVNAGTVKCKSLTFTGSLAAESDAIELEPSYKECTAFGFVNTTVDVNGCKYKSTVSSESAADKFSGTFDVVCPGTSKVTVTAFNCEVTIASQAGLAAVEFIDTTAASPKKDIDLKFALTGVKYTQTSKSFPGCSSGSFTNGTYSGETTVKGTTAGGTAVGIEVG